ncbi:TonB-dependent receptor [Parahaliea sp. F7430]|uniref:TonB-dependent receptor n=1 Tax=Sediminihaliea albiluteola TaxID=2758564 RepID=A0A7W2YJS8_9GAMM|nr:TonB-dependent receptor [Sediminihaliea albiluteola]MBA6412924.1 TonB-dependent receptor [Sediminihaliea albiluteola]
MLPCNKASFFFRKTLIALGLSLACTGQAAELEEILVTAEFRPTRLLDQPNSTSVVSQFEIKERAAQHLEEVLNLAPNVNYAGGSSRARFYQIRGIGERSQFQEPLNPSIGFIIDGIDFSGLGTVGGLFDVDQVEVLRGPQGTLHGANALAGLINVRSAAPKNEPGLSISASAANYDTWSLGLVGTGPLIKDTLLFRLAVQEYRSDGFSKNTYLKRDDTANRDETMARAKLRWLASDTATLDVTAFYADVDNGYDVFSLDNTRRTLSDEPGSDKQKSSALAFDWQQSLSAADLEARVSWASSESDYSFDEDWAYVGIAPELEYSSFDQFLRDRDSYSAELRLLSNESSRLINDRGDWVVGLYYLADREDLVRRYTYLTQDFRSTYDTDTLALFTQLDTQLSERLSLLSGLRVEQRRTDYYDNNGVASDPKKNLWGGRLTLEYQLSDDSMLYAGLSRGYRANGINAGVLASMEAYNDPAVLGLLERVQRYDDESLLNYEAGFKASFLDKRLSTRLALFYMDRKDQQVKGSLVIPRPNGSTDFIDHTNNAASGNNYGLELELDWLATDSLQVYAHLGLLETRFDDYINSDGRDLSGRDQAHAPSYQYAIGGRYDLGAGFFARLDIEGKDKFYFSDRHELQAPSFNLVHMRLGYASEQWSLALWGRNLGDKKYAVRGFGSFGNDPRKEYIVEPYYQYGEPRQVGISADYHF